MRPSVLLPVSLLAIFSFAGPVFASSSGYDDGPSLPAVPEPHIVERQQSCGAVNGPCNKNGCQGLNDPSGNAGFCLSGGSIQGCSCDSVCGPTDGPCNRNGCKGVNDPTGGPGLCTAGDFKGCHCSSVCGSKNGPCDKNGCQGINSPGGAPGVCTAGDFAGCLCDSICGNKSGPCSDPNCKGVNGFCTAGSVVGCPCDTQCGDLEVGACNKNGCDGINSPEDGFGICQSSFKGCSCTNVCGEKNGPCNKNGCNGVNGKCTAGQFNGCNCDG